MPVCESGSVDELTRKPPWMAIQMRYGGSAFFLAPQDRCSENNAAITEGLTEFCLLLVPQTVEY